MDLFTTNHIIPSRLFKNMGNGEFLDVAPQVGLDFPIDVFGSSWGDYNRDGFIDVFLNGHIGMALMENSGTDSNFLILRLIGDGVFTNTSAIGTRVEVNTSSGIQIREVSGGEGCCSQDMLPVHFGLGNDNKVDIVVRWDGGEECIFEGINVTGGRLFSILEDGCELIQN
jgi:enediyne biosynthesis protein E4